MTTITKIFVWKKAPFIRLLIPVIAGIVAGFYINVSVGFLVIYMLALALSYILFSLLPEVMRFRFKALQGWIITLFLLAGGCLLCYKQDVRNSRDWYGNSNVAGALWIATVKEPPVEKPGSYKVIASMQWIKHGEILQKATGDVLVYIEKDSLSRNLKYGSELIFAKLLQRIKNSGNPGEFDYVKYAAFHNLFHQVYLRHNDYRTGAAGYCNVARQFIFDLRKWSIRVLEKYLGNNHESALAKAILIGYKVDLDSGVVQAFSNAGLVHLIAISGLHMGIVYGVLTWLLAFVPIIKTSSRSKIVAIIAALWLFAFLTGASPSVLRAALMFSFILLAKGFDRKSNVYNSLAASAFFLLCLNPYLLFDVGFQLSYLAVLGIVMTYQPVLNWLYFKNKWLQRVWQLAAISIAAQVFTFPLCFFYFHQLPLLFVLSNLVAIPLATLCVWGCLILLIVSPVPALAVVWGKCVIAILWALNHTALLFDKIPYSVWTGVFVTLPQTLLLFVIVAVSLYAFEKKDSQFFKIGIAGICLFTASNAFYGWRKYTEKRVVIYNIPSASAMDFMHRDSHYFLGDSAVLKNSPAIKYNIAPARLFYKKAEEKISNSELFAQGKFFQFYDRRFLYIDSNAKFYPPQRMKIDYVVLAKNAPVSIAAVVTSFDCSTFIFDGSNSASKVRKWKKECDELNLRAHSVAEQGAFVINF